MTRIAILADIHANLPALDAVVADVREQGCDEILVGGDLVGRGPQGSAVVSRIQELGWPSVRGNHEDYLINFFHRQVPEAWLEDEHWAASRWMAAELGARGVAYAESLPFDLRSSIEPSLYLCHGTPASNQEGVGTWTKEERLAELADELDAEVMICAHTHRPLELDFDGLKIVNVGSVGLPFNGDWRAQYAIMSREAGAWSVEFRQVPYDRDVFLETYRVSGFLAAGGSTSAMLAREIKHARPFLVPFLRWAELTGRAPSLENTHEFLDFYDPSKSMKELFELFQGMVAASSE